MPSMDAPFRAGALAPAVYSTAHRLSLAAGIALSIASLSVPVGCSTSGSRPASASTTSQRTLLLAELAQSEATSPVASARMLPPPPGVQIADVSILEAAALTPEGEATRPLSQVLVELTPTKAPAAQSAPDDAVEQQADPEALRLYAVGREKLLSGRAAAAATDLEAAVKLDPTAARIWRELGEAQQELGKRSASVTSFQRAASLGIDEPRVYWLLGRESARARRFEDAARNYTIAKRLATSPGDSSLRMLIDADLSDSLRSLGYIAASRDALIAALQEPAASFVSPRLRADLGELYRRRAELWLRAGDMSCKLGQYAEAEVAYTKLRSLPAHDPGAGLPRLVHALLKQGRPAAAGIAIIDDIRTNSNRLEERHLQLLRYLRTAGVGDSLATSIGTLTQSAGPTLTVSQKRELSRASAAAASTDVARERLAAHLAIFPDDAGALNDAVALFGPEQERERLEYLVALIRTRPAAGWPVSGTVFSRGQGTRTTIELLQSRKDAPAAMLRAALLVRLGRAAEAAATVRSLDLGQDPESLSLGSIVLDAAGAQQDAVALRAKIVPTQSDAATRALAEALEHADRPAEALATLRPLAEQSGIAADLRWAAQLCIRSGDLPGAEVLLGRALEADCFDESIYDTLIGLYVVGSPIANEQKLTATARQLRQNLPGGRLIRLITGRELVQRSLWTQAEPQLMSLMDEHSEHTAALSHLVLLWERSASSVPAISDRGEAFLRERLAQRPEAPGLTIALARVLSARGKPDDADKLLSLAAGDPPIPELARQREIILRDQLNRPDEADALAVVRLANSPKTVENTIEFAIILVRQEKTDQAAKVIDELFPAGANLTPEQSRQALAFLSRLDSSAIAGTPAAASVLRIFDSATAHAQPVTAQLRLTRLLLVASATDDPAELLAAVDSTTEGNEQLRLPLIGRVAEALGKRKDPTVMLRFLGASAAAVKPQSLELIMEWYRLTFVRGDAADGEHLVRTIKDPHVLAAMIAERDGTLEVPPEENRQRAQIAYAIGGAMNSLHRTADAEAMYRLSIKLDSTNPWTMNNLGYLLLERGQDLPEAEQLISRAYEILPGEASIIDSLGWVRYKRGHIADRPGENGQPVVPGALTLLEKAAALTSDDPHAEIVDHLGDALWRSGKHEQARENWMLAQQILAEQLENFKNQEADFPGLVGRIRNDLAVLEQKLAASAQGQEPQVSPLAEVK